MHINLTQLKYELHLQLEQADIPGCFDRFKAFVGAGWKNNALISAISMWRTGQMEYSAGRIGFPEYAQICARITASFAQLIDELSELDRGKPERILVVCRPNDKADERYMRTLLPASMLPDWHISYCTSDALPDLTEVDLIVFDNHENEVAGAHLDTLQDLAINALKPYIVYYGQYHELVKAHKHRINAANFPFTLVPRIRETLEFRRMYFGQANPEKEKAVEK